MKTIKNSKDITTLEIGDKVVFGSLEYIVCKKGDYFLRMLDYSSNDKIFTILDLSKIHFIKNLGIDADYNYDFPETKSLEALTAIVSALFKEYEKQNELPKTWEEFCEKNPIKREECFVTNISMIQIVPEDVSRDVNFDKNVCSSKKEAEAHLALIQLRQLRKAYIKDWEPDWEDIYNDKFCVGFYQNELGVLERYDSSCPLSFPTEELATQFLTYFKDLLEIAKPLL